VFKLKGLDQAAAYKVWSEDGSVARGQVTGAKLMTEGLKTELADFGTSDLIYLQVQ